MSLIIVISSKTKKCRGDASYTLSHGALTILKIDIYMFILRKQAQKGEDFIPRFTRNN